MYKKKKTKNSMGKIKHKITIVHGIKFDSKMESEYYVYLKKLEKEKIVSKIELQPEFLLQDKFIIVDGKRINGSDKDFNKIKRKTKAKTIAAIKYISDFKVTYANGNIVIVDVKGIETKEFVLKRKMFNYKFPELKLDVVIKRKNEWISFEDYKKAKKER